MDPRNPDRLFAGLWDFRRKGWTFRSGSDGPTGPSGSGLFLTEDGGSTWKKLDAKSAPGLPEGPWGRLDVAIAPSSPDRVYAVIESVKSALYRSDDGGKTWARKDDSQRMVWRPFYFSRLVVDPTNPDRIYKPNLTLIASEDGGASFGDVGGGTHGDHHDVWVNPKNPKNVVTGDDGGLWISYDGGNRWWKCNNLPVSQFYHVSVDDKDPYQVYGGLQDNSSWAGDSAYPGGITNSRWENLYNSDGFWVFVDPLDPNFVYAEGQGGYIGRIDRRTLAARDIQPKAGFQEKLRWNWNTPIHVSRLEKGKLYIGSQFLFVTKDGGQSWQRISPDLTTNDPEKQKQEQSGGITVDNSAAEMNTTIYSICESPRDGKTIWVGTDDGNLQLTRDGGKAWTNLVKNVPGLPPASWVSWVEAGPHADGDAYAAFDRHTFGDMTPWVYATHDFGRTWERIVGPASGVRGWAWVIKEDPVRPGLLYLGTEFGLFISLDAGKTWAEFKGGNFPSVAVRDLAFAAHDKDLVVATHGRGIWILDDLTPLRALTPEIVGKDVAFLPSRPVIQKPRGSGGWPEGDASYAGPNPPSGAVITYYQKTRHTFGRMKLEILDASGRVVDTPPAGKRKGINRVVWSMQEKPPRVPTAAAAAGASTGPRVLPGTYTVRLTKGKDVVETPLVVALDPRAPFTLADRKAQYDEAMKAHALFGRMSDVVDRLNGYRALAVRAREGAAGGRRRPEGPRRVRGEGGGDPQGRRRHVRGRRDHGRGAAARAPRLRLRRDPLVRGPARRLPGRARGSPRARAEGRRGARGGARRRRISRRSTRSCGRGSSRRSPRRRREARASGSRRRGRSRRRGPARAKARPRREGPNATDRHGTLALAHGEPRHAAVGIRHHPSAGRQRPRDDELRPLGGVGACRHDGDPHKQREQSQLQRRERSGQPWIHTDEHAYARRDESEAGEVRPGQMPWQPARHHPNGPFEIGEVGYAEGGR